MTMMMMMMMMTASMWILNTKACDPSIARHVLGLYFLAGSLWTRRGVGFTWRVREI